MIVMTGVVEYWGRSRPLRERGPDLNLVFPRTRPRGRDHAESAKRRVEREGIMHRSLIKVAVQAAILTASILGMAVASLAAGFLETDLVANKSSLTDSNGIPHTPAHVDPNLLNPWGLTASSTSPFWVSDNGAGVATLYNTAGTPQALVVSIPAPGDPLGTLGKGNANRRRVQH